MVSLAYDEMYLANRIDSVYWQMFPRTSHIRNRTQIIYWENGLLVGLTDHFCNSGDPLELLTEMYLDAKGLSLFNFNQRKGTLFERFECNVTHNNQLTKVDRYIRGVLHFSVEFIDYYGKKYLIVKKTDSEYKKFDRILNPLTQDDFNAALLR